MAAIEQERLTEQLTFPWWVKNEHWARYRFALRFTPNKLTLDCACGTGEGSDLFAKQASKVLAVDISKQALAQATRRFLRKNLFFRKGSALHIPARDHTIDTYVSLETIEHIKDDHAYLIEAVRALKPQGTFVCSTPNRLVTNPGKTLQDKPSNPFHVREYSPGELAELLNKYFQRTDMYGLNPNGRLKVRILALIGRLIPGQTATRIHQLLKLVLFVFKKDADYVVKKISSGYEYEYLVAVCRT